MSDAIKIALIVALAPTIASVASLVASVKNHSKLKVLETKTDGMQEKLEAAAHAEGVLDGKAIEKQENQNK